MFVRLSRLLVVALLATALAATSPVGAEEHEIPAPDQVLESDLTVRITEIGTMPFEVGPGFLPSNIRSNIGSPVAIGNKLYLIDQNDGIYRTNRDGTAPLQKIFDVDEDNPGDGLTLENQWAVLNMSRGRGANSFYVVLSSETEPTADIPIHRLPDPLPDFCCDVDNPILIDDLYRIGPIPGPFSFYGSTHTEWQVLYEFKLQNGKLVRPRPIMSFEDQYGPTHNGGGMLTLGNGQILFSPGDGLTFGADGRAAPQDANEHVGKWLLINPNTSTYEVAALGVRESQHIEFAQVRGAGQPMLVFSDIGGVTAEEINFVSVAALRDTRTVENFGWGRNADGLAREGTFYIQPGIPAGGAAEPPVDSVAPVPEPGFIQPHAQYGRNDPNGGIAVSGAVTSFRSFDEITTLFSDLSSGIMYATTASPLETAAPVYRVNLVDENGAPVADLNQLNDGVRADPRFFRFPNGMAGVILEGSGTYYMLEELG